MNLLIIKKVALVFSLALILAGCTNSTDNMEGMDHSKMSDMEHSQMSNADEPAQNADVTDETATLEGKNITLTAKTAQLNVTNDISLPVWTFNNSVPGPEIRVKQGERVQVILNNTLPEPVSIHWHGVPVPNEMDGIPGVTQNAVQPGESFTYDFIAEVPGTYWYHSHQDSVNQVDKGLYGSFIVEEAEDDVDRDYTLILDEWSPSSSMNDMDMENMESMDHGSGDGSDAHESSMEGHDMSMYNLFTINGKSGDSVKKVIVNEGEKVRIRLTNAGYLTHNMHLHGHEFKVTSTDGQTINEPNTLKDQLISIAPGERYDIEFTADNPGEWFLEEHSDKVPAKGMKSVIAYENSSERQDQANETVIYPIFDLTKYGKSVESNFSLDQKYDLEYTMNLGTEQKNNKEIFTINGKTYPDTEEIKVNTGDLVKVKLVNNSKTDEHPMHLHGHFFQVLSKNGKQLEGSPVLKDTLNLKPGEEYVVAFKADNPGDWMFHCHELHHASAGMVTHLLYNDYEIKFKPDPNAGNKAE
jgi:FtsP/CotA-like multicopper oxidase with cupredoxin domain